ncbi:MAG: hypothetical protein ABI467_08690 [Kofleriaceae bacterium]
MPLTDDEQTRTAVQVTLKRVLRRIASGEQCPSIAIPRQKDGFPRVLCLDMNQWIYLSRVHYGLDTNRERMAALESIRQGVASGRLIVPVMQANVLEASEAAQRDRARRRRLAAFMIALSSNCCIVHPRQLLRMEVERAIRKHFLQQDVGDFARERLVRWGVHDAVRTTAAVPDGEELLRSFGPEAVVGIPPEILAGLPQVLEQAHLEPEMSVLAIVDALSPESIAEGRRIDERAVVALERARPSDRATRVRILLGEDAGTLRSALDAMGIQHADFSRWLDGHIETFVADVASVDVATRLFMARDRNGEARVHRNDMKDMFFLEQAIPYGNLVVTEKSWAALAAAEKLDQRYATRVLPTLQMTTALLKADGVV